MSTVQVRNKDEAQQHIESLTIRVDQLEQLEQLVSDFAQRFDSHRAELDSLRINFEQLWEKTMDHEQRFDTLQTPWWKRVWFRIDGWPGHRDLNAERRARRPWH